MISIMEKSGHTQYGLTQFVLDSEDDLENLPIDGLAMGCTAFIIETSEVYMFSSKKKEWIKI